MKITIGTDSYSKIKEIDFSPETDVIGGELPINTFTAEIYTDTPIEIGQYAFLYDKNNVLWAKYWITDVQKFTEDTYTIYCQSDLMLLERKTLGADRYANQNAKTLLQIIFSYCNLSVSVDSSLENETIDGFFPEQTAKERVQWICFVIGGYVKSFFNDIVQISPLQSTVSFVSPDLTYFKPSLTYADYVTAVEVTSYSFRRLSPDEQPLTTDEWVFDGSLYYVVTKQKLRLDNVDVSSIVPENVISVDNLMLINSSNANSILSRLSQYYFNRVEVTAEIVNNGDFLPGEKILIDTGIGTVATGFIRSLNFSFGNNSKTQLVLKQVEEQAAVTLIIVYKHQDDVLERRWYNLPSGYSFTFENPLLDLATNLERLIYYPTANTISGSVGADTTTAEQQYILALYYNNWNLSIYDVDSVSQDLGTGEVTIA